MEITPKPRVKPATENPPETIEDIARLDYEHRVREIQKEIDLIDEKLAEIATEEKIKIPLEESAKSSKPIKVSRRGFLASLGLAAGAAAAGPVILSKWGNIEPKPRREKNVDLPDKIEKRGPVEREVEKAKEIIEGKKYSEIIKNPYLVSALYYSDPAIKKMSGNPLYESERIITGIHPLITPEFREGYLAELKKEMEEHEARIKKVGRRVEVKPLDQVSLSSQLGENHLDAVDVFTKEGSPIYATSRGLVVLAENGWKEEDDFSTSSQRGGNTVIIFNPDNESFYRYAHMEETRVTPGVVVEPKDVIGIVGHSGINASKPGHGGHLHYEINRYDRGTTKMVPTDVFALRERLEISLAN